MTISLRELFDIKIKSFYILFSIITNKKREREIIMETKKSLIETVYAVLSCTNGKVFLVQVDDDGWDVPKIKAKPNITVLENIKKLEEVFKGISIDIDGKGFFRQHKEKNSMVSFYLGIITPKEPKTGVSFGNWIPFQDVHKYELPEKTAQYIAEMSRISLSD
jgi:hypothetical protein